MKKIVFSLMGLILAHFSFAQDSSRIDKKEIRRERMNIVAKQEEEGVNTYTKHFLGGVKLISDGYGAFLEIGRARSVKKALLFQFEFSERKHQKEDKYFDPQVTAEPIIYGKINYVYPAKLGVQQQFLLGNKGNKNGVNVTANIGGGLDLALLRPYFLKVDLNGERKYVNYNSSDSIAFLTGPFYGAPGFGTGWNKLSVVPGIYIKPAMRFDYGIFNEGISAIEVGMTAEYFTKNIPQVAYNKQKKLFFSAYVAIIFGKRK